MSEAENPDETQDEAQDEEQEESEPSFRERVAEIDVADARDKLPDERTAEEKEAIKVAEINEDYERGLDSLGSPSDEVEAELDRLYNELGLSLEDIGRLYDVTDATVQRKMEQNGLERRGSRTELSEEDLIEALRDLAVSNGGFDTYEDFVEAAEAGDEAAVTPTTTLMTDEGAHSAHTYYSHWDSWAEAVKEAGVDVDVLAPDDEDDESDDE